MKKTSVTIRPRLILDSYIWGHSVHRLSPSETRLCAAPDVESIEIVGASDALGTDFIEQSANQR